MITIVNMIPALLSGEANQDSEPNLSVNPANPFQIAGSAFTPDPFGGSNAPIYVSFDGGNTWVLNSILPSQAGSNPPTGDVTVRFAQSGNLYAGILRIPGTFRLNILITNNFLLPIPMTVLVDQDNDVDQPYVQALTFDDGVAVADRVYVGSNARVGGDSASVDVSLDGAAAGATFARSSIDVRSTVFDGPPIRPAVHADGTVYAAFYRATAFDGVTATVDVVVVRDDNGAAGAATFADLVDPGDGLAGRLVVQGRSLPFLAGAQANFGQERLVGSNLSIAVDPSNSDRVFLAWADGTSGADYTLHVQVSDDRGDTWSDDIRTVFRATNPALAVNDTGTLGFLFQALNDTGAGERWETHFEQTDDDFGNVADSLLADVPADDPVSLFEPYIGDYVHLLALENDFFGIFSANNTPDGNNFPSGVTYQRNADFASQTLLDLDNVTPVAVSIDPFFFKVTPD